MAGLTRKQKAFVEHYLQSWNATEAALLAGYSEKTAYSIGHENLSKPEIEAEIEARVSDMVMDSNEVLTRLAEQARASLDDFITICDDTDSDHVGQYKIDLLKAKENGKLHLLKSISPSQYGIKLELHDQQSALQLIGKHLKLFVDRTEVTGANGGAVNIELVWPDANNTTEST